MAGRRKRKAKSSEQSECSEQSEQAKQTKQSLDYSSMQYWIDKDGDPCIGNVCFKVKFNRKINRIQVYIKRGGTCPREIDDATKALMSILMSGGETEYMVRTEKDEEEEEE